MHFMEKQLISVPVRIALEELFSVLDLFLICKRIEPSLEQKP